MSEAVETVRERFSVDNDMKAEWCLSKIRSIRKEQERETAEIERQMQFYLDRKADIAAKADEEVRSFESMLMEYFVNREESGFTKESKSKISYKLPTGELMLKHREPEYDKDEPKIVEWLKKNSPEFVKVKESPDWSGLKKTLRFQADGTAVNKESGEIVPGIKAIVRDDEFCVEVK